MGIFIFNNIKKVDNNIRFIIGITLLKDNIDVNAIYNTILQTSTDPDKELIDYITRNGKNVSFYIFGKVVKPTGIEDLTNLLGYCTHKNINPYDIGKYIIIFDRIDSRKGDDPAYITDSFTDIINNIDKELYSKFQININKDEIIGNKVLITFLPLIYN